MPTIDDGRQAIAQGNPQQARLIFEALLQENPRSEEAWLGLAEALTKDQDKRVCYENALKINKNSRRARDGLRNLEPQENPFVAMLGQHPPPDSEEAGPTAEATTITPRPKKKTTRAYQAESETSGGPPTYALVAIGLALSVVVFALGSGTVYFLLPSIAGR